MESRLVFFELLGWSSEENRQVLREEGEEKIMRGGIRIEQNFGRQIFSRQ
jgi:hypothetical protein